MTSLRFVPKLTFVLLYWPCCGCWTWTVLPCCSVYF